MPKNTCLCFIYVFFFNCLYHPFNLNTNTVSMLMAISDITDLIPEASSLNVYTLFFSRLTNDALLANYAEFSTRLLMSTLNSGPEKLVYFSTVQYIFMGLVMLVPSCLMSSGVDPQLS